MENVKISNDPIYPDIQREVKTNGIVISFDDVISGQRVILNLSVLYFDSFGEPFLLAKPLDVNLVADNSTCVDALGNIVPCDSPDAVMTEYQFYEQMLMQPVVINDMVTQKILWADSQGRFNIQ